MVVVVARLTSSLLLLGCSGVCVILFTQRQVGNIMMQRCFVACSPFLAGPSKSTEKLRKIESTLRTHESESGSPIPAFPRYVVFTLENQVSLVRCIRLHNCLELQRKVNYQKKP